MMQANPRLRRVLSATFRINVMPALSIAFTSTVLLFGQGAAGGAEVQQAFRGNLDVDGNGDAGAGERTVIGAAVQWWEQIIVAPPFAVPVEFDAGPCPGPAPNSQSAPFEVLCVASDAAEAPNAVAGKNLPAAPPDGFQNIRICTSAGGVPIPWFVDATPHLNEEFAPSGVPFQFDAIAGGPAAAPNFDLLTCVKHELGHVLGFQSSDPAGGPCVNPYTEYCTGTVAAGPTGAQYSFPAGMPFAGNPPVPLAGPAGAFPSPVSHIDPTAVPGDLMNPEITAGTRRVQSVFDRQILSNAFNYGVNFSTHFPVFQGPVEFAQFGNGGGFTSEIVLQNLADQVVGGRVQFYNSEGELLEVGLEDGSTRSGVDFAVGVRDALTIATDGLGPVRSGSAVVDAEGPLSGVIRFNIPGIGIAGVGSSRPASSAIVPVRRRRGTINTGMAIRNSSFEEPIEVNCSLFSDSLELATTVIALHPRGRSLSFIDQLFPEADTSDFSGSLLCTSEQGRFSAIALELGRNPGEFTTLPVEPLDSFGDAVDRADQVSGLATLAEALRGMGAELQDDPPSLEPAAGRLLRAIGPMERFSDERNARILRETAHIIVELSELLRDQPREVETRVREVGLRLEDFLPGADSLIHQAAILGADREIQASLASARESLQEAANRLLAPSEGSLTPLMTAGISLAEAGAFLSLAVEGFQFASLWPWSDECACGEPELTESGEIKRVCTPRAGWLCTTCEWETDEDQAIRTLLFSGSVNVLGELWDAVTIAGAVLDGLQTLQEIPDCVGELLVAMERLFAQTEESARRAWASIFLTRIRECAGLGVAFSSVEPGAQELADAVGALAPEVREEIRAAASTVIQNLDQ